VDRTGSDDDYEPVVHPVQDPMDRITRTCGRSRDEFGNREFPQQMRRRREFEDLADAQIVGNRGSGCHKIQEKDT
jgi:hypothetical protein